MSSAAVSDERHQPADASSSIHRPSSGPPGRCGPRQPAEDERPEPVRVADADDPPLVEDDEAERAADARQDLDERLDRVGGGLVGEERRQQLGVGRGRQPGAAALELRQQVARVDEVAVVADRDRPPRPEPVRRLGVLPDRRAGRRVAAVGDGEAAAQARQAALVEDRADHPEVLVEHQLLAVADRDPGRLLAAVLEREQPERRDRRRLRRLGTARARPPRTRRTSGQPSQPRARASPCSQAWRRSATGPRAHRRSGCRVPRRRRWRRPRPAR